MDKLLDVSPGFSNLDIADSVLADAKHFYKNRRTFSIIKTPTNFKNIKFRNFGLRVSRTCNSFCLDLFESVRNVFAPSNNLKICDVVIGLYAINVINGVLIRYGSNKSFSDKSMNFFCYFDVLPKKAYSHVTIAVNAVLKNLSGLSCSTFGGSHDASKRRYCIQIFKPSNWFPMFHELDHNILPV